MFALSLFHTVRYSLLIQQWYWISIGYRQKRKAQVSLLGLKQLGWNIRSQDMLFYRALILKFYIRMPWYWCHRCLTSRSVRGYVKRPQCYLDFVKMCKLFFYCLQSHLGTMKHYMIPACMTALNEYNDFFVGAVFSFWGKMIWMNYPVTPFGRVLHLKAKPQSSESVSFSKHTYITATAPVTVIPIL